MNKQTRKHQIAGMRDWCNMKRQCGGSSRSSCGITNQWIPRNANNSNKCNNTSAQLPIQNDATKREAIHRDANSKRRRRNPNLFEKRNGNCDDDDDGGFFNSSFPFLSITDPTPPPTHISTLGFPTAIDPSRRCLNPAVIYCCCAYSQKKKRYYFLFGEYFEPFLVFFK